MALSASNVSYGWHGVRAEGLGAYITLTGTGVSGVRFVPNPYLRYPYPPRASVEAHDKAIVWLYGSTVGNGVFANGVMATTSGKVEVRDGSVVEDNDGIGALATTGGRVVLWGGSTFVRFNDSGGLRSIGSGSTIDVWQNAKVQQNLAYGATSESGASLTLSTVPGPDNASLSQNRGGVDVRTGGVVWAGQCDPSCPRPVLFNFNQNYGQYDVRAKTAGGVLAEGGYWNGRSSVSQLVIDQGGANYVYLAPLALTPNGVNGTPRISNGRAVRPGSSELRGDADGVEGLVGSAHRLADRGQSVAAGRAIHAAYQSAQNAADRRTVAAGAVALAGRFGLDSDFAAQLRDVAQGAGENASWAQRILVTDALYRESDDVLDFASRLISSESVVDGSHGSFGFAALIRHAASRRDATEAARRLRTYARAAPPESEDFSASVAVVVAAFPGLDLDDVFRSQIDLLRASSAAVSVSRSLRVSPNPSSDYATLVVEQEAASKSTRIVVYDALGRLVAVIHDGPVDAGSQSFLLNDTSITPGIYVIVVRTSTGTSLDVHAVRWTRLP